MAVISFKCPNCDGELIFDPATQKYKCEYCNSLFSQAELDAMNPTTGSESQREESETPQENTKEQTMQDAVRYSCPSCGAEIITDATTAATFCYYCHNPVVLGGRLSGEFLPNKVIPFDVTREAAEKGFLDYVGKKKFVPKSFFQKKQIESMTGVYFPYWHYDVQLEGNMQGEARDVRVWRSGNTEYTQTKFYDVRREGEVRLHNLTENALQKANAKLANGIMPYDFRRMKDFHMGYLSGFVAERRDIEQAEVQSKMQSEMRKSAENLMRESVTGHTSVSVRTSNFWPKNEKWSYVLLPIWTITYRGKNGKIYYYSMNGQTGKVCGELPVDHGKLALVSGLAALGVLVFGLLGGFFV